MAEVLYDERPRYPAWARWVPIGLAIIGLIGVAASTFLGGRPWVPDSPRGWLLIGVAAIGLVAWVLIEAGDLSWLPGGRDGIRLTDAALHLGDTTFKIDELTGEVTWEPGHPEQLELGLIRGGTLPVETERPDELRNALRRALPA